MASIRKLPSGNWQASVLLDDGSRTTSTYPTAEQAVSWAGRTEAERDERRAARNATMRKERVDIVLAELSSLIQSNALDRAQWRRLRDLVTSAGPSPSGRRTSTASAGATTDENHQTTSPAKRKRPPTGEQLTHMTATLRERETTK
jgi:hypothetical protein